jgi:putative membrane protein
MFVDYLTLVMITLIAGFVLLAYYLYAGLDASDQRPFAAAFGTVGVLEIILGLSLSFTWPLPGSFNIAYGETTTLFGAVFLGAAVALSQGWDLMPVALFGFFAGLDAFIMGARIISLKMGQQPLLAGISFFLAGLAGVLAAPTLGILKKNKALRMVAIIILLITALAWCVTYVPSVWAHLADFAKYVPASMK